MRFATIRLNGKEEAAVVTPFEVFPIQIINEKLGQTWSTELFELIRLEQTEEIKRWYRQKGARELEGLRGLGIPHSEVLYAPLYRHPRKIWGIGLNYVEHASDLHEQAPSTEPASFMKPDTTIKIGRAHV